MIIRPAVEKDLETMAQLTRDALSFASSPDPYHWAGTEKKLEERLHTYLSGKKGTALVAEIDGAVVGFIAAHFDELDPEHPDRGAIIDLLAVSQEQRGFGFGTNLVRELMTTLPEHKITRINVDVLCANDTAVRFWRRLGFHDLAVTMTVELGSKENSE
jgi:ribosomal protein S18 acetylase RimI-like enzyme